MLMLTIIEFCMAAIVFCIVFYIADIVPCHRIANTATNNLNNGSDSLLALQLVQHQSVDELDH